MSRGRNHCRMKKTILRWTSQQDQKDRSTTVCLVGVGGQKKKRSQLFSVCTYIVFICISYISYHLCFCLCVWLSLLYVSGLSSRFCYSRKILSGPALLTLLSETSSCTWHADSWHDSIPWLGNDPAWRCLHLSNGVFQSTEPPLSVEWLGGVCFLLTPKYKCLSSTQLRISLECWLTFIPTSVSCTVIWWHCWGEILRDRAPLSIRDDTFFSRSLYLVALKDVDQSES